MPAQPAWFHQLDSILSELRALKADYLDRRAVERIFDVRERRARQLMAGLPCLQIGNAVAIHRQALLERLENIATSDGVRWEVMRRQRLAVEIEALQKNASARRIRVPFRVGERDLRNLSPGIEPRPREIRIQFDAPEACSEVV